MLRHSLRLRFNSSADALLVARMSALLHAPPISNSSNNKKNNNNSDNETARPSKVIRLVRRRIKKPACNTELEVDHHQKQMQQRAEEGAQSNENVNDDDIVADDDHPNDHFLWNYTPQQRFSRFGIIGFASPSNIEPVEAIFKQTWSDFVVTEIPAGWKTPIDRTTLGDFTTPPMPAWLAHGGATALQALIDSAVGGDEEEIASADSLFLHPDAIAESVRKREERARQMVTEAAAALETAEKNDRREGGGGGNPRSSETPSKYSSSSFSSSPMKFSSFSSSSSGGKRRSEFYLQCVLRKHLVAHTNALALVARALHVHPLAISVSGIKDYKGDTAQLMRIRNIAPAAAFRANFWIASRFAADRERAARRELRQLTGGASARIEELERQEQRDLKKRRDPEAQELQEAERKKKHRRNFSNGSSSASEFLLAQGAPNLLLSNFSYQKKPLVSGKLEGNHFRILLRDVPSGSDVDARLDKAADGLVRHGFPNFFGCQRFSWFCPPEYDPAFALLHGDLINFAFRMLEYTTGRRTMRELLQRKLLYPMPTQESFRRALVKALSEAGIAPSMLDSIPFCVERPELGDGVPYDADALHRVWGGSFPETQRQMQVVACIEYALATIAGTGRRLMCQALCSYLWNLTLSERIRRFGLQRVLPGDLVIPMDLHAVKEITDVAIVREMSRQVTAAELADNSNSSDDRIFEVHHPRFNFHNSDLTRFCAPEIEETMRRLCHEYGLAWETRHPQRLNIRSDFTEGPRPICVRPRDFSWRRDVNGVVELQFSLGKGSYANVCVREFLRCADYCPGQEEVHVRPAPEQNWDIGKMDPGAKELVAEELYPTFSTETDGITATPMDERRGEPIDIFAYDGPWSRPDESERIRRWTKENLLGNVHRREKQMRMKARELFEPAIANTLSNDEILRYGGHTVPMQANAPRKRIAAKVFRQKMKRERNPRRRRMLASMQRRVSREIEFKLLSTEHTWTPQR